MVRRCLNPLVTRRHEMRASGYHSPSQAATSGKVLGPLVRPSAQIPGVNPAFNSPHTGIKLPFRSQLVAISMFEAILSCQCRIVWTAKPTPQ